VYVQWFHQYETDSASVELVLRTYLSVFEQVAVWYGAGPDLLLLGFPGAATGLDLERLEQRAAESDIAAGLKRSGVDDLVQLLAHELLPAGVLAESRLEGPIHTLLHPRLSHTAGRAFFMGGRGALPFTGFGEAARIGAQHSLLRRYLARFEGGPPDAVYASLAEEACRSRTDRCAVVLAEWGLRYPGSPGLEDAMALTHLTHAFGEPVGPETVASVRSILPGAGPPPDPTPLADAKSASEAFRHYYDHGFAFDAEGLLTRWDRCHGPPDACDAGRAQTRAMLAAGGRIARTSAQRSATARPPVAAESPQSPAGGLADAASPPDSRNSRSARSSVSPIER
jgi:hypothetical protein